MARLGEISLNIHDKLDSGLAQLLVKPPKTSYELYHNSAFFRISPESKFCICAFKGAESYEESIIHGTPLIQEFLDLMSIKGKEDLAIKESTDEYITWWTTKNKTNLAIVTTATLSFSAFNPTIIIKDSNGNIVLNTENIPAHFFGYRYFRLAQISDDLFDSYRNMYLAFESLLSSIYPKGREQEIVWLNNSLNNCYSALKLHQIVPSGVNIVDYIIDTIYKNARLPLFHAKSGRLILLPSEERSRTIISKALSLLTKIVLRMIETWHSCNRNSSFVNIKSFEEIQAQKLSTSFIWVSSKKSIPKEDEHVKPLIDDLKIKAKYKQKYLKEYRPNVKGATTVKKSFEQKLINCIYLTNDKSTYAYYDFFNPLDISGINHLEITLFLKMLDANQPKSLFIR
jgi:hypothetical protein